MPTLGSVNRVITANGVYTVSLAKGREHFLRISGTPNGATVKLEYVNANNANTEFDSSNTTFANTTGGQIFTAVAETMQLNVTSVGASTNIAVEFGEV